MTHIPTTERSGHTVRSVSELVERGLVAAEDVPELEQVTDEFATAISPAMLERIESTGPDGGVARQFVPKSRELLLLEEERPDPIGDVPYMPMKGITHRYADRLLLMVNHHCAVYCRFCFRREKVGPNEEYLNAAELDAALDYIRAQPDLHEVILTGGDPLMLPPSRIKYIVQQLSAIEGLDVIRFHTRIPVVAPERLTPAFMDAIESDKIICVVVHANHADEFGDAAKASIRMLRKSGVMLVSHSVLLKGVNDTPEAMMNLMREFVRNGIKPYYLHHCDLAEGISHFRTNFQEGQELIKAIRGHLSGLAQPLYVLHIPEGHGKVPIGPSFIERHDDTWVVEDYLGGKHEYPVKFKPSTE